MTDNELALRIILGVFSIFLVAGVSLVVWSALVAAGFPGWFQHLATMLFIGSAVYTWPGWGWFRKDTRQE